MRRRCLPLALAGWLLLAAASGFGQSRAAGTSVPRSQYSPMAAAQAQGRAQPQPDTWYSFLLKQFNPNNLDYGTWMEERRRAFLEATVKNPYFLYSFWLTVCTLLVMSAYAKLSMDGRRERFVTEEMMTDLYNHDLHSRAAAREAIEKYNGHIERCNRVIEAAEGGQPITGSGSESEQLKAKLQQAATDLKAMTEDRGRLKRELEQKSFVVTDLTVRLRALEDALSGDGRASRDAVANPPAPPSNSEYVKLIDSLQQQLYAEREKNKHLKGA